MNRRTAMKYTQGLFAQFLALCLLAAMLALTPAIAQASSGAVASSVNKLKAIATSVSALQQKIPMYYISPESLAEVNDYDPEKIAAWVKKNIQFTPSPGYQLSPEATLQTATGNALEQAKLLQSLLVQAGLEVRLSHATLDTEQANTLLRESFVQPPARLWQLDNADRDTYYQQLSLDLGIEKGRLNERYTAFVSQTPWPQSGVFTQSKELAGDISAAIQRATKDKTPFAANLLQPWLVNAQDYYFVKYRFSQGDPWQEAHPAFSNSVPTIVSSKYFTATMDKYHHKVTLQAFITRESSGEVQTIPVSGVYQTTVAQLFKQQVRFDTTPSGMPKAIAEKSLSSLQSGQIFAPSINGKLVKNARLFSLDGSDYSPGEINNPVSALSRSTNKNVGAFSQRLEGALGSKTGQPAESAATNSRLLRYFLNIEWSAPTGQKRSMERTLYRAQTQQSPAQALEAITQRAVLAVAPGILTPAAEMHASLETLRSVFALLAKLKADQYTESQNLKQLNDWASKRNDLIFNTAAKISAQTIASARLFSHAPVLAIKWERRDGASASMTAHTTFDYLINAAQVAVLDGETAKIDPAKTLGYGVWSTYSEAMLLADTRDRSALPEQSTSAANTFSKAITPKGFSVLNAAGPNGSDATLNARLPSHLTAAMVAQPQQFFVVPKTASKQSHTAYYRVNSTTAEALGYTIDGRGSSGEYAVFLANMGQSAIAAVKMLACIVEGDEEREELTCLGCATLQLAISLIGGAYFSAHGAIAGEIAGEAACAF